MKKSWLIAFLLLVPLWVKGQGDTISLDEVVNAAERWARENLDEDALRVLDTVDQKKVREVLKEVQKQFRGDYVIDLAVLRDSARAVLPLLETHEETLPYAVWLKSRLDYLDVAKQLREANPPSKAKPNESPKRIPNPPPQAERDIWIKKMAERPWPEHAKPYVGRLKPIFVEQNVPAELVWVAEVESSFDPRATSPAGAAGMFQLMPATAQRYGLRTSFLDQRYRPEESAQAAAKYLRFLHGRFKDWRLALAAYNAGEGAVQNILTRHKATTYDAIAKYLSAETQMYVPRVEATLLRREGLKLTELRSPKNLDKNGRVLAGE